MDAEELTQEIVLAALQRIEHKRTPTPFAPWLFSVARSVVADAYRALLRRPTTVAYESAGAEPVDERTPAQAAAANDEESHLWRVARRTLSARQFEALELRVRHGLDLAAIATAMGLTANHVKVLLFRTRQRLLAEGAIESGTVAVRSTGSIVTNGVPYGRTE